MKKGFGMLKNLDNYRELLKIDKQSLDEELVRHPVLFDEVSQEYVLAVSLQDQAKEAIRPQDAGIDLEVREEAKKNKEKITEAEILALVQSSRDHTHVVQSYLEAKFKAEGWGALKEAFHRRGYMLRDLVSLYISGYFSERSISVGEDASDIISRKARDKNKDARRTREEKDQKLKKKARKRLGD